MGQKPIAIDLFCGVGGMSLGFRAAGFEVAASVDFDPIHTETYKRNFPNTNVFTKSVSDLRAKDLGLKPGTKVDVVFGGPPCQGFSVIGKRDANDDRNRLLLQFARVAVEIKPKYIVIENVAGLLFPANRPTVAKLFRKLKLAGYQLGEPQILDAQDFGVPQRRRRVFIVAARRDMNLPKLPLESSASAFTVQEAFKGLPYIEKSKYLETCDVIQSARIRQSTYTSFIDREFKLLCADNASSLKFLSGCMKTAHSKETIRRFKKTEQGAEELVSRFRRLSSSGVAPTLRAGTGRANGSFTAARPIHPIYPRCITVREGARLHSYPDWFQFHPTKWHGFRQVGNSVPPLMAKAVATRLLEEL